MYDYVKALDSKEKMMVTLAYSEAKDGVRQLDYIYEKQFNRYSKVSTLVTGETITELISQQKFCFEYGGAVGEISKGLPRN